MSNYKSTPSLLLIFFSSFLIANLGFLPLNAQEEAVSEPEEYEEISEKTEQFLNQELHPKNKLNKKSWKKNSETFDFREEKQKEEEDKKEKKKKIVEKKVTKISPWIKDLIKYSLFSVVIVFLVILLYKLVTGNSIFANKKIEKQLSFSIEEIEENLFEANMDQFIAQSIAAKEYKMAIRLYYLNVLKILAEKNLIVYKKDKTNGNYIVEIMDNSLQKEFKECTSIYEYVWFKEEVNFEKDDFEKAVPTFKDIIQKASSINS